MLFPHTEHVAMRTRNAPFAEALKGERSTYKSECIRDTNRRPPSAPSKKIKIKNTRTSLVLLVPRLENKIAEEAKACTMITTDENEANKNKRQSSIKDMDPSPCHR
jgi:hypothetical protein